MLQAVVNHVQGHNLAGPKVSMMLELLANSALFRKICLKVIMYIPMYGCEIPVFLIGDSDNIIILYQLG